MVEKPEKGEEIEILVSEKDKERIKQRQQRWEQAQEAYEERRAAELEANLAEYEAYCDNLDSLLNKASDMSHAAGIVAETSAEEEAKGIVYGEEELNDEADFDQMMAAAAKEAA